MPDVLGGDLIDRGADADIRTGCLLRAATGEERGARACVVAGAVVPGGRVDVVEALDDLNLILERGERLHRGREFELFALALGPPRLQVHTVGDGDEGHS